MTFRLPFSLSCIHDKIDRFNTEYTHTYLLRVLRYVHMTLICFHLSTMYHPRSKSDNLPLQCSLSSFRSYLGHRDPISVSVIRLEYDRIIYLSMFTFNNIYTRTYLIICIHVKDRDNKRLSWILFIVESWLFRCLGESWV